MAWHFIHPVQARMRAFQDLFNQLDQVTGTKAKVQALVDHFQGVDPGEAAWALTLLLGKRRRRLITGRRLRDILRDRGGLPDWLIDDCYGQVGDSAETISLLWPAVQERVEATDPGLPSGEGDMPLRWWMDTLLPAISTRSDDDQANAVIWLWHSTPPDQHFIVNKLLTGGFRVGVSTGLISRAIAEAFDLEESLVVQRLMGGFEPSAERFVQLTACATADEHRSSGTPYPFYLASPLEPERLQETSAKDWQLEWKWDGIRGQLIHRGSGVYLWSRGEELVNESFPELVEWPRPCHPAAFSTAS
jgi:DNA ligase-1